MKVAERGCARRVRVVVNHTKDVVRILVEAVIAELIGYVQRDQKKSRDADREPGNVDRRVGLASGQAAKRDKEVVSEHGCFPVDDVREKTRDGLQGLSPIPATSRRKALLVREVVEVLGRITQGRIVDFAIRCLLEEPFGEGWRAVFGLIHHFEPRSMTSE
ncbi:MAG: hypothetical protein ACI80V_002020 [Rhodothermales bacterium]